MKNIDAMSFILFSSIFPILIGILLRLPKLINEIKKNSQLVFDLAKFFAIGLPSLCILSMYILIYYLPKSILSCIPQEIFLGNTTIQTRAGIVFGFILLDSVKK